MQDFVMIILNLIIMSEQFDFESFSKSAIEKLKQGQPLTGTDGVFTPLLKMILEASSKASSIVMLPM